MAPIPIKLYSIFILLLSANQELATDENSDYDVIIVGAGLSGLTAAYRIKQEKPDVRLKVLEARSTYGGRVFSPDFEVAGNKTTDRFDLGGDLFGIGQVELVELLKELDIEFYEVNSIGDAIVQEQYNGPVYRVPTLYYKEDPRDNAILRRFAQAFDNEIRAINLDGLPSEKLKNFESLSLDDYLKNRAPKWCRDALSTYIRQILGVDSKDVSFAFFVMFFQKLQAFDSFYAHVTESRRGQQKVTGGGQRIVAELTKKLGNTSSVDLDSPVIAVNASNASTIVECGSNVTLFSKLVILAIPPATISQIAFNPPLSSERMKMYADFQFSHFPEVKIKAVLTYETAFWRRRGLSGLVEAHKFYDTNQSVGVFHFFTYDASSALGSPALSVMASVESKDEEKQKKSIISLLTRAFGGAAEQYVDYQQKVWAKEPYIRGEISIFGPKTFNYRHYEKFIRKPEGNIHFAGAESAEKNLLLLAGAVSSGNRVAREVLGKAEFPTHSTGQAYLQPAVAETEAPRAPHSEAGPALAIAVVLIVSMCIVMLLLYALDKTSNYIC